MDPESPYMFMFLCVGVNTGSTFCPNCGLLLIILTNWIKTWLIKIKNFWCNLDWTLYWLTLFHKQFIKRRYFSQHMVSEKTQLQKYFCINYMNSNFRYILSPKVIIFSNIWIFKQNNTYGLSLITFQFGHLMFSHSCILSRV